MGEPRVAEDDDRRAVRPVLLPADRETGEAPEGSGRRLRERLAGKRPVSFRRTNGAGSSGAR